MLDATLRARMRPRGPGVAATDPAGPIAAWPSGCSGGSGRPVLADFARWTCKLGRRALGSGGHGATL